MLTPQDFGRVVQAALSVASQRGQSFYDWVNPPEVWAGGKLFHTATSSNSEPYEVTGAEALEIMTRKINGAYGERFICSLGTIAALIANGYSVRFVQFRKEVGVPFNAQGWTVIIVESMPIFHISPEDLRLEDVADIVEILDDSLDPSVSWKNTNKVGEFAALLRGSCEPGLDLVKIAQSASK